MSSGMTREDLLLATPTSGMALSAVKQCNTSPAMLMANWGILVSLFTPLPSCPLLYYQAGYHQLAVDSFFPLSLSPPFLPSFLALPVQWSPGMVVRTPLILLWWKERAGKGGGILGMKSWTRGRWVGIGTIGTKGEWWLNILCGIVVGQKGQEAQRGGP